MDERSDLTIVGVGASAGGVEVLLELVSGLDEEFPAAILIVLHQPAGAPTVLADILARRSALLVQPARHGVVLQAGHVYVAPPDHHLSVDAARAVLTRGPKMNGYRPSVDWLLRSIARAAGPAAVGVVLSGTLDDGASGLGEVVRQGGSGLVQDPLDALYDGMPRAALRQVPDAVVRPGKDLPAALTEIVRGGPSWARPGRRTRGDDGA